MNYELAKELKDAGFPRETLTPSGVESLANAGYHIDEETITLSELIEACGSESFELADIDTTHPKSEFGWRAKKGNHASLGQTPEEAVAMLWLELRK